MMQNLFTPSIPEKSVKINRQPKKRLFRSHGKRDASEASLFSAMFYAMASLRLRDFAQLLMGYFSAGSEMVTVLSPVVYEVLVTRTEQPVSSCTVSQASCRISR